MWHKYTAKWGVQMPGMNFQTRSSTPYADDPDCAYLTINLPGWQGPSPCLSRLAALKRIHK
ncbi:DUF6783 domain-containing protein [Otoolea muris]|uniref:DUF6783 domain-containing protein n=1 Tax=Otoolea muris TaxID=2941515 RepID=UPI002FE6D108